MSRSAVGGATLLVGVLLGAACAPDAETARVYDPRRPWVIATTVDLAGVNELVSSSVRFSHEVHELLFDSLLTEQPDFAGGPPSFEPSLAASWSSSDDGLEVVLRLRPEARWSDGRPLTADDVVFSHRAQVSDEVAWAYADSKDGIAAVEAIDERSLRVRFRTAYPHRLVDLNDGFVLPAHAWGGLPFAEWRRAGDWFRQRLVTSGPYRLASWSPGVEIVLERNPHHWRPPPEGAPERVVFRIVPDPAALIEQLLAGAFDFYDGLTPLDAERVARAPHLRLVATAARQYDYIGWNLRRAPFDDATVRLALSLAIDREALVDALLRGYARVAVGPVPAAFWARDSDLAPWPYDPDQARTLLAAAGFADRDGDGIVERDGRPLRFEISTNAGNRTRADALVLIQEQLARVGVAAEPRLLEIHALTERNRRGEFDATLSGWAVDTTLDLRPYFHSREIRDDGWNWVGFADDEVDRLLDETRTLTDLEASRPLFARIQRILHQQQPYTFLWEPQRLSAVRTGIEGVEIDSLSAHASLPRWRRLPATRARR